ncbi:ABC transporter permease [Fulvivirgaceae bacterium PWU4]|uniref:ABC transporter permease n=1 Tax=Chryseosolibacter histidini TaxID=2782349 RepID=A0AAP2GL54_9BACT|nr:ABC transporter permease [Chryseosolibacter histidini]MBT1700026.1 ABC transporter permease [Chryseosolibacter histidini]
MLKNYLTIGFRNLRKHRFYSFINIAGLAIGLAACLIMVLFVMSELSYDRHFKNAERIQRVNCEIKFGSTNAKLATVSAALPERLSENFPEIESSVRIVRRWGPVLVNRNDGERFKETEMVWADSSFFKVFSIPVLHGDANRALAEPNQIAISRKMAEKYFPEGNAVGQSLFLDDENYQVTVVFENFPVNTHVHFEAILPMANLEESRSSILIGGAGFNTYLLLKEGTDAKKLETKFPEIVKKYVAPQLAGIAGSDFSFEKFLKDGNTWTYSLTPLTDIHLHSNLTDELEPSGSITYVYLFSGIALLILVAACINFMNLSTARSANRAKEVGMRKVMGSLRPHLVRQFMMESLLLMLFSVAIALVLAQLFIPVFNDLALKKISIPFYDPAFYAILFLSTLVVGVSAGLYPSFFLSAFKPVDVLKGKLSQGARSGAIRSVLVVFQFLVSIFLITATIAINRQLTFIHQKKLGFEKEQVIVVKEAYLLGNRIRAFKEEMMNNSFIKSGSISGYLPVTGTWRGGDTFWKEGTVSSGNKVDDMLHLEVWNIDHDYLRTLQMEIKEGRGFSSEFASDSISIILNEEAVKKFGFGKNALGQRISRITGRKPDGTPDPTQLTTWTIIGVVKDFHFSPMKTMIKPLAFQLRQSTGNIIFRFQGQNTAAVIEAVQQTWSKFVPDQPLLYSFLDQDFEKMYESETRLATVFGLFAGLAIMIACLGLFALTAFMTEQRTREIGIRKVLGASVTNIVVLISREFSKLILISFIISIPFAWYAISRWLESYSYKTEIGWMVYAVSGIIAAIIALFTIGYQSIKAAIANPVNSLKNE